MDVSIWLAFAISSKISTLHSCEIKDNIVSVETSAIGCEAGLKNEWIKLVKECPKDEVSR